MEQQRYVDILKEELVPALGCTEPIAIAYAAARAREVLGCVPERITAECSGDIIKNVKGVIVPGTKDMKGIETSAILGVLAGKAEKSLEVLVQVTEADLAKTKEMLAQKVCSVKLAEGVEGLYIKITVMKDKEIASVTVAEGHTNIVEITRNGSILFAESLRQQKDEYTIRDFMTIEGIYNFVTLTDTEVFGEVLEQQIRVNKQIADEGLQNKYGANVGKTILKAYGPVDIGNGSTAAAGGADRPAKG